MPSLLTKISAIGLAGALLLALPAQAGEPAAAGTATATSPAASTPQDRLKSDPAFGATLKKLTAKAKLPKWTQNFGTAKPLREVSYQGKTMLMASGCEPDNCPASEMHMLYDPAAKTGWAAFIRYNFDPLVPEQRLPEDIRWFGKPDNELGKFMLGEIYSQ